jgi:hypothetical protein
MTATTYIAEIAPTRARGAALGFYQLFVRPVSMQTDDSGRLVHSPPP